MLWLNIGYDLPYAKSLDFYTIEASFVKPSVENQLKSKYFSNNFFRTKNNQNEKMI
jgi:hypothetical protein